MPEAVLHTGGFNILHNQAALPAKVIGCIRNVRVEQEINVPATFSFTLTLVSDGGGAQGATLDTFAPGDEITILMGRDRLQRLIIGQITAIEPRFAAASSATVRGFDRMYRLRFGKYTKAFEQMNDGDIVEQVARASGVTARVEGDPTEINDYVKQNRQTNYEFLLERAEQLDYELLIDGTTLVFRPSGEGAASVRDLLFPRDLSRADLDLRVPTEGGRVIAYGFNPETNEVIQAESQGPNQDDLMGGDEVGYDVAGEFPDSDVSLDRSDISDVEALQVIADAQYQAGLVEFIKGSASLTGDPALIAGVNIKLAGLSDRFDGLYYITAAVHSYDDDSGYATELTLRRSGI